MISLCITTYNRTNLLLESFKQVLNDTRISEIIIVDDHSEDIIFSTLQQYCEANTKIKLYRNRENLGCYRNKREAVSKASNEWVILFDSDNIIDKDYINALFDREYFWRKDRIFQPIFASPNFNFTQFAELLITKANVHEYAGNPTFTTALNAMNYFVNRDESLRVWEDRPEPWTADSLLQNYNWLKAGNSIYFCPGLEYTHRVHDGSHYKEHHRKTGNLYNELVLKLKNMR